MKIDVVADGSYRRKVQVSVPAATVREELDRAYKTLGRKAHLRGFRKGKVPRRVLELRFGPGIRDDVSTSLIQKGYTDAVSAEGLEPVGRPTVEDRGEIDGGADFQFTITVDVKPAVELTQYTGLDVDYPAFTVSDDELQTALRARLEAQTRLVEVTDRPVEKGDMVLCELIGKDGDEQVFSEPGTMIRTEADPYYPGVEALLEGLETGAAATGEITFSSDAKGTNVAGRTLEVTANVISIQANQIPDLSDEVAQELGFEGGAEGMRVSVRGELSKGREEMARNQARANLLQVMIDANPFDVPSGMVDQQLDLLVNELKLQQAYRGVDPRSINFNDAQMADLRVRAAFAVKGGLILDYVTDKESLAVTDADLEQKYQDLADERGQTVEAIKGYFLKDDSVEELRGRLLEEKALDWLLDNANIISVQVPQKPADAAPPEQDDAAADPVAEAAAEPAEEVEEPSGEQAADLSILKGSIKALKEALESGNHDADLDALLAAEQSGKARAGALKAIQERQ